MSDSGTRTRTKQTREQWLDAHNIYASALREEALKTFATRDDIQAYVTGIQGRWYPSRGLYFPRLLGISPAEVIAWKDIIGDTAFGHLDRDSRTGERAHASRIRAEIHSYLEAGVPPEYLRDNPGRNSGWSSADIVSAWEAGLRLKDFHGFLHALSRRQQKGGSLVLGRTPPFTEVEAHGTIPLVFALHRVGIPTEYLHLLPATVSISDMLVFYAAGVPSKYIRELPASYSLPAVLTLYEAGVAPEYYKKLPASVSPAEVVEVYRSGAEASIVAARLKSGAAVQDILSEVEALTAEYWNLIN